MTKILDASKQRILKVSDDRRDKISRKFELSHQKAYAKEYKETLAELKKWRADNAKAQSKNKTIRLDKLVKGA